MNTVIESSNATAPADIATMRETATLLLGPENGREMPPPAPDDLETLTALLRGHLQLLIPLVEARAARQPEDSIARYCALACVGEARRKLSEQASPRYGGEAGHARRLARVLRALCDHYEARGHAQR
ncbi:DUF6415 family natural product biosynthesis protein [Streptomyces sp. Ru71]|uniref:DUF6415 family natural product biosynthesis protein n=1 Tax=Streptomyces sp. Ru71 TaxID=2080746 RepID=UPI0011AFF65B|nr:DUF6415 family natural product biosynthesis protein [Streptomyces sp. Ru71]